MSGGNLRRSLLAFDDATLEALASKGLLRRAGRDLAAGKVALMDETAETARIRADGEEVTLGVDGPVAAACSCKAPGVCRHRLAAVLLLRQGQPSAENAAPDTAAPPENAAQAPPAESEDDQAGDPLAEVLALTPGEIAKWAGKATLRAAEEMVQAAREPAIEVVNAALVVRLTEDAAEVRYLAGQGLAGIVSKAPRAKRKALHAAAVLAVRRRHGAETAEAAEPAADDAAEDAAPDPVFLDEVGRCLADCVRTGFNQAPLVLEERLFALSVSSRADALPRLSALLRSVASRVRAKRERSFSLDPDAYLALVAEAYALAHALRSETGAAADPDRVQILRGQVRQDYRPVGRLTLYGMGARLWHTATGARGVTGHFYAPDIDRWFSAGHARSHGHDGSFSPSLAYQQSRLWSSATLSELSRGRVVLDNAAASADGRLSLAQTVTCTLVPAEPKEQLSSDWPVVHRSWRGLEGHLQERFTAGVGRRSPALLPVVLEPAAMAQPYFDERDQETIWPLRDAEGVWLALTLAHGDGPANKAAEFEQILRSERPRAVAALAFPGRRRFTLQPYALFLPHAEGGCFNLGLDQVRSAGVDRKSSKMRRLGRDAADLVGLGRNRFARPGPSGATERLLTEAGDALLGVAELGGAVEGATRERMSPLAERLDAQGLSPLAGTLGRLISCQSEALPPRLLEAVYLVDMARSLLRPLPHLRLL